MSDRIAIIDMGTNTFNFLVADTGKENFNIVLNTKLPVKMGKGGINQGLITSDGMHRTFEAMKEFKRMSRELNVSNIHAFGTSALRNAKNGEEIIQKIKSLTGIEVTIISGEQEAEYIYFGIQSAMDLGKDKSLIVDIGGGSVEFIIGNRDTIFWKESFEVGAQRLLEQFHRHDPMLPEEISALHDHLKKSLPSLFKALQVHNPTTLVGSSGTFDTLSDIYCITHGIHKPADACETPLTLEGFKTTYHELLHRAREERLKIPGMIEMRVDMIVTACCLINYLMGNHSFKQIRVSSYSLKEGVLAKMMSSPSNLIKEESTVSKSNFG